MIGALLKTSAAIYMGLSTLFEMKYVEYTTDSDNNKHKMMSFKTSPMYTTTM